MAPRWGIRGCLSRSCTTSTSTGSAASNGAKNKVILLSGFVHVWMCIKRTAKKTNNGWKRCSGGGKPALQCCVAQCCSAFHFQRMEKCCPPGLRSRLGSPLLWACDSTQLQLQFPQLMRRGRLSPAMTALFLHMKPLIMKAKSTRSPSPGKLKKPT